MNLHHLIQLLFASTGLLTLVASLLDCDWFFTAQNIQWAVKALGRRGARLLYTFLGALLVATALYFYFHTPAAD